MARNSKASAKPARSTKPATPPPAPAPVEAPAPTPGGGLVVSTEQLATFLGIETANVRRLGLDGSLVKAPGRKGASNQWLLVDSVRRYCTRLRENAAGRNMTANPLNDERIKLLQENRAKAALQRELLEGKVLRVEEVEQILAELVVTIRKLIEEWPMMVLNENPTYTADDVELFKRVTAQMLTDASIKLVMATGKHPPIEDLKNVAERVDTLQ